MEEKMSTYYRPTEPIPLSKVRKLKEFEVKKVNDKMFKGELFFDGKNYLHFATDDNDNVIDVFRYGGNDPYTILDALEKHFDVEMVSEHDENYWNFASDKTSVMKISLEGKQ
jgi:hypothetical protein|tara:strand:+ start:632 stop:967 length:336 start_codon:yes stop_codon:yes gene_type:complete